jgi:hypothetical protein
VQGLFFFAPIFANNGATRLTEGGFQLPSVFYAFFGEQPLFFMRRRKETAHEIK